MQISSLSDPNDAPTLYVVNREQTLQIGYAVHGIVLKVMFCPATVVKLQDQCIDSELLRLPDFTVLCVCHAVTPNRNRADGQQTNWR